MKNKVFVNRLLNMRKIKYLGLDMDHTLIRYHTQEFEATVYNLLLKNLSRLKNYPEQIKNLKFNFDHAIRGLVLDCRNGNTLKLSRHGAIRQSFHGTQQIGFAEQKQMYHSMYVDLSDPNYLAIDTSFSIAFCVLYGQVVELKDKFPGEFPSYAEIAVDISFCLDRCHRDGSLKSTISGDLDKFVIKEPAMVEGLKEYRRHGKKIFIATNSEFHYTKTLLDYAINPYLDNGETWESFFEFVITLAQKPRFFYDNLNLLKIDPQTGNMTNAFGPVEPGVYQGGSANKLTLDLKLSSDDILYIGDHIYGDILRLKKDCNWRTALVVEEMEQEVDGLNKAAPFDHKISELMIKKEPLENRNVELTTRRIDENTHEFDQEINRLQDEIAAIDLEIGELIKKQHACFNEKWGPVFRAGAEESFFAHQVDRFACIYMAKLADLLECSPRTYFRAMRRPLAHEVGI